jgi:NADH-quinone oxidoreductase subunit F
MIPDVVDALAAKHGRRKDALIPILLAVQAQYHFLPEEALRRIAAVTDSSPADIAGVASFYRQFRLHPAGKHSIHVCHGTACHVKGSALVDEALRRKLEIGENEDTDSRGEYTVERVACIGCCSIAPVMRVDDVILGRLTPSNVASQLDELQRLASRTEPKRRRRASSGHAEVRVSLGSCCVASGAASVSEAIEAALAECDADALLRPVNCTGLCHQSPMLQIAAPGKEIVSYSKVSPDDAEHIIRRHFSPSGPVARVRAAWTGLIDAVAHEPAARWAPGSEDGPICEYLGRQKRIAMEHGGLLSPVALGEYLAHDGFAGLHKARSLSPEALIEEITRSGLRGRGGAGFPTGRKWAAVRKAIGAKKYVICNGDEGDPGAFMDRMLLESFPYRVIEGLMIAAHAVGADEGILYIRAEYPKAVERVQQAIDRMKSANLLNGLSLRVFQGAGAFVCGEETALIASIEGGRGVPRIRPPYPAQCGLNGCPTCVNNVETLAMTPWILRNGAAALAAIGSENSKGTKVFSVAGKVARVGLVEVPMGTTIRQIVEDIAGAKSFKAVQIGGPSGGCVPESLADTPIDYEALSKVGAIMGSGGLVVMDEHDCMVDIAHYFIEFTARESCGHCSPCRIGTHRMLDLLKQFCNGKARRGDIEKLEELANEVKQTSICGLGQTAPNPVLTTLTHFRSEYEAHIEGICPAHVCRPLIRYDITQDCIGCTLCAQECPVDAIPMTPHARHHIDDTLCTRCDACRRVCPEDAIEIV